MVLPQQDDKFEYFVISLCIKHLKNFENLISLICLIGVTHTLYPKYQNPVQQLIVVHNHKSLADCKHKNVYYAPSVAIIELYTRDIDNEDLTKIMK